MALTKVRAPARSALGYAYVMTGVAIGGICVSGVFGSIFTPDLISGSQHQHTPVAAYVGWIVDVAAIAMVAPAALQGIRAKVTERAPWTMLGIGTAGIWLAVMFVSIFTPVLVTGTDPTKLPIGSLLAAIAGLVLTWLVCKMVKTGFFEVTADAPLRATGATQPKAPAASSDADTATKLHRVAQLRDSGVISEPEFQAKKEELLRRI